jgi:hypothetical protein
MGVDITRRRQPEVSMRKKMMFLTLALAATAASLTTPRAFAGSYSCPICTTYSDGSQCCVSCFCNANGVIACTDHYCPPADDGI